MNTLKQNKDVIPPLENYSYNSIPPFFSCGCSTEVKERTDCYFYHEEHDMGARIPFCSYHNKEFGHCPCKDCDKFLSKSEADKIINEYVSAR